MLFDDEDLDMPVDQRLPDITALNTAYVSALDAERLEDWPGFFFDQCLYKITTSDNVENGYEAGLIYADSRAMLQDRVAALRQANIYEGHRYRHILSSTVILAELDGVLSTETSFLCVRTMRDGDTTVFATGAYMDKVRQDDAGEWRYVERIVVCDSPRIDTLLAIPL